MGTQQILLIVLSVIIVGVAIAVGITMFNSQAYNANKTAIAADAQSFGTQVLQYYKTPVSQGGAGGSDVATADTDPMHASNIAGYLGFSVAGDATTTPNIPALGTVNENGTYTIASAGGGTVVITGVGFAERNTKNPQIITTVTLASDTITAVASDI